MSSDVNEETSNEMVTITKKEYERLLDREFFLQCLQKGGVDNWEWYDASLEKYRAAQEED